MQNELKLLIDGRLVDGAATMAVVNPATEEAIAQCPRGSAAQFNEAVAAAKRAFPAWSSAPIDDRRACLVKIADAIEANADEMARLLTTEQGKPLDHARGEIDITASFFRYVSTLKFEPREIERSEIRHAELHRRPLGVIAAIIPWNFPLMIMSFKLPPALLVGNTIVLKPAATTPLATLLFAKLIASIVPPGVVNVVTDANDLGDVLTGHPDVAKVSFTGSSATGLKVMANAAKTMKRFSLELGGNDPAIIMGDVDPAVIARAVFNGAFFNSGQVCLALKRLYVHESKYDAMCEELAKLANAAIVDDGLKQGTQLGPLQNKNQYEKVKAYLQDAEQNGRIIAGGDVPDRPGYFVQPTIVVDMEEGTKLVDEEQFGPILPILKFKDVEDVVRRANATNYGLGASVWSKDVESARKIALRLEAGTVWVNQHIDLAPHIPQGGAKMSGIGIEIGQEGLLEFTQVLVLNVGSANAA